MVWNILKEAPTAIAREGSFWSANPLACPYRMSFVPVTSYYTPDGSFKESLVDAPIEYMSCITWLDIEFVETPTASPRLPRDDRVVCDALFL